MPEISASETKASVRAMSSGIRHGPRATCLAPAAPVLRISVMTLLLARFAGQRQVWLFFRPHPHHVCNDQASAGHERSQSWTELSRGADGRFVDLAADMAFELAEVAFEALGDVARRAVIGFLVS